MGGPTLQAHAQSPSPAHTTHTHTHAHTHLHTHPHTHTDCVLSHSDCNIYGSLTSEMAGAWGRLESSEMPGNLLSGGLPSNWAGSLKTVNLQ